MKIEFDTYKERLFAALLNENHEKSLLEIVHDLHNQGYTKAAIYEVFLQFHREIQIDCRSKDSELVYDNLSDFMDGFTSWAKGREILPDNN